MFQTNNKIKGEVTIFDHTTLKTTTYHIFSEKMLTTLKVFCKMIESGEIDEVEITFNEIET